MALPPLSFNVPQPRRSIIEEALGVALASAAQQFISAPFERKRADEAARRELTNLPVRMELERGDLTQRLKIQNQAQIDAIVPTLMERIRGHALQRAEMGKIPVSAGAEAVLDVARTNLGLTPEQISATTSLAELEDLAPVLSPAISSAQLEIDRERNKLTGEYNRDLRRANAYAEVTKADIDTWGNVMNTDTGELLDLRDIQLIKTGAAKLAQIPELAGDVARLQEIDAMRRAGKLRAITLNQGSFTKVLEDFRGMEAGQIMQIYGQTYPFLLYGPNGKRLDAGEVGRLSVFMQGNPDLLDALAASRLARNMNDILDAEKATSFKLSPRALGYLSLIFRANGQPYEHPDAEIPGEIPDEIIRELGVTRVRPSSPGSTRQGSSGNPLAPGNQGMVSPPPKGSMFTGLQISAEQQYPEYLTLQEGLQTRLRSGRTTGMPLDTAKYTLFAQDFVNRHVTPEKAVEWYKSLGVPEERLRDLIVGDSLSKARALQERLSFALGALQNARDAIQAR